MTQSSASFEGALSESEELLLLLETEPDKADLMPRLYSLLSSIPGCRGFFVCYLTGESSLADQPPDFLLDAFRKSNLAHELLVKNLVMSSATQLAHLRRGDDANAQGSAKVAMRSGHLIKKLALPEIQGYLNEMQLSLKSKQGKYADFVARCNYDNEQVDTACSAIDRLKP
ncbi:MAG: hypothetical protein K2X77_26975 [Candidatus Obscuribacterales bacterium]|jgi:hypothetical protein|nr:hypothetical protein [Candidatus Obscuribacterales bacterium]